jgi:tRNA G37 N-methylase Trm5
MTFPIDPRPLLSPTAAAHRLLAELVAAGDIVVDATAGNGHDTVFLAEAVGDTGRVIAFDIQEEAVVSTRERVEEAGFAARVELFQESHALIGNHAEIGTVAAVMFNLGYLPGADHALATGGDTINALEAAAGLLMGGGALSVVCYPGHSGGDDEAKEVEEWMIALASLRWRVVKHAALGTLRPAPFLLFAVKPNEG